MCETLKELAEEYPPKRKTSNIRIKYPNLFSRLVEATSFLAEDASTSNRLWHITNGVDIPTCKNPECSKNTKWVAKYSDYAKYCGKKCYNKHKTIMKDANEDEKQRTLYGENYKELSKEEKIKITNIRKYGIDNPFKDVNKIRKANRQKYGVDFHFQKHLDQKTLDQLDDYDWLYEQNQILKRSCMEIANELGVNNTTVNKRLYSLGITPSYTYSSSFHEKEIVKYLRSLNVYIEENNRNIINPYELDIYLPEHNLAIEYCGLYWHNELHKDKNYHANKFKMCQSNNIRLLTIFEDEFEDKKDIILKTLGHIVNKNDSKIVYPRKCYIEEISSSDKKQFFENTHIQGDGNSSINIALKSYNTNEIVACAAFLRSADNSFVLNRFSTGYRSPGAISKILAYFEAEYSPNKIITFADLRWSVGNLYEKVGFKADKIIRPDYYYIKNNKRIHKFNFRHKNLKNVLQDYDPSISEHQNCLNNKIYRIYDCGKIRYVKEYCT